MGRIQARTIKARRRHGEQTCRPAGALRAHYHASFLLFVQSIGLLCTGSYYRYIYETKKSFKKPKKFWIFNIKKLGLAAFEQDLVADQIIVVWFSSQHNYAFLRRLILTSTGPNLAIYTNGQPGRKREEIRENQSKRLGKLLNRASSEGSIDFCQSAGRKPGGSVPQKIPYHVASQPPNSKIQARTRTKRQARNNRQT